MLSEDVISEKANKRIFLSHIKLRLVALGESEPLSPV